MARIIGNKIIHYGEIDSTNDEAKRLVKKGMGEGTVVVADMQTKGRGKPGSGWFSPGGSGIYLSVILKPYKNPNDLAPITLLGAKAVVRSIEKISKLKLEIKLPNDVMISAKKVCGILTERLASGYLIIGIGVNINNPADSFPPEINNSATSLKIEAGEDFSIDDLRDTLISELDQEYRIFCKM